MPPSGSSAAAGVPTSAAAGCPGRPSGSHARQLVVGFVEFSCAEVQRAPSRPTANATNWPLPSPATKLDEPFSVRSEEKRQEARGKKHKHKGKRKGRRGRIKTKDKIALDFDRSAFSGDPRVAAIRWDR